MFCRKCGKEIPDDSLFCPKCGANLSEIAVQVQTSSSPAPTSTPALAFNPKVERIENLHRDITVAMKKIGYGILDEYSRTTVENNCIELKSYNNGDFIANDCLVHLRCQELGIEDYSRRFDTVIELINLALSSCPSDKRQYYAEEEYYPSLLGAAQKVLQQCKREYYDLPPKDMFGRHLRTAHLRKFADRDLAVYQSLVKVLRIPCLSDEFLDSTVETLCLRYSDYDEHQGFVMMLPFGSSKTGVQFSELYSEELKKNYPEYARRRGK